MKQFELVFSTVLVAVLLVGLSQPAAAAECGGVEMPETITVDGTQLTLNGQGMREATAFKVDVYVASLYVEDKSNDSETLSSADSKKSLVLTFVRDVDRSDIVDAYKEGFKKTAGDKHASLAPKLEKLNGWMSEMNKGDTQAYEYVPGEGLDVRVNGQSKGTIKGADFAEAFFKIWLGSSPPNEGLKRGLLGGECG